MTLEQLAATGLRGKDLTDALYKEMFGTPPPPQDLTPEDRHASLQRFFALMDTFTDEELNDGFMQHRPRTVLLSDEAEMPGSVVNAA